jgi:polyisoprenoid-binding protein YceI
VIKVLPRLLPIALSLLLAACPSAVRKAPEPASGLPSIAPPDLTGATLYAVSSSASEVDVMVFRGGTFARLGHNHVLRSKAVTGRVWLHPQIAKSGLELSFPVQELIVDDPQARRAAGGDFPPEIAQADKDGTRKNMLRAEVLDGERHPKITLRSVRVAGSLAAAKITVRITIKEVSRDLDVPAVVALEGSRLSAAGEFDILQTDFGIKPFSIALGALEVQDRLHVKFRIVAEKT